MPPFLKFVLCNFAWFGVSAGRACNCINRYARIFFLKWVVEKPNGFTFAPLFERQCAGMAELVDAYVSGAYAERCGGSSPPSRTGFIVKELCASMTPFFVPGTHPTQKRLRAQCPKPSEGVKEVENFILCRNASPGC